MVAVCRVRPYGRFIEIQSNSGEKNLIERIKADVEADLIETIKEPQSNLEENVNPRILKDDFSSRTDPSIFTLITPVLLDRLDETSEVYPALKSSGSSCPSPLSRRSDSSSETNSCCCHRSDD